MKKVLFTTLLSATPHIESELERMEYHHKNGDSVFCLKCTGEIYPCVSSSLSSGRVEQEYCKICPVRWQIGMDLLSFRPLFIKWPTEFKSMSMASFHFKNIHDLKKLTYKDINIGMGIASFLITYVQNEAPDTEMYKELINLYIKSTIFVYHSFSAILDKLQPDLVYIFNGRNAHDSVIRQLCTIKNIDFYTHDRMAIPNKYRITKNDLPHSIAPIEHECNLVYKKLGEQNAKDVARQFYENQRKRLYDRYTLIIDRSNVHAGNLPSEFNTTNYNIVFFNSTALEYEALPNKPNMTGFYSSEVDALKQIADSLKDNENIKLYFRMHPNMARSSSNQLTDALALTNKYNNLIIIPPDANVDSYALINKSDLVIAFHSTIGAEAAFAGKPVILLGDAIYKNGGGFYLPNSHDELIEMVRKKPKPKEPIGAIKYGAWCIEGGIGFNSFIPEGSCTGKYKGVDILDAANKFLSTKQNGTFMGKIIGFLKRQIPSR